LNQEGGILTWFPLLQERPLNGGIGHRDEHSRHGTTLLILDVSMDMPAVVLSLKARGLRPIMMPLVEDGKELVARWRPQAVVLQAGLPDWLQLLGFLGKRGIPCVLLGTSAQLRAAARHSSNCLHLLLPAEPEEITEGVELLIGPPSTHGLPAVIDLGAVRIDLHARTVEVDGIPEVLPPKEFEILVQLALQPGRPLGSTELLGRVWRGSESATVDDLHTRIWRLRRMIGDHKRIKPLIVNRRGFGYLLNVDAATG
jgi:DNA-binding response OmpR family regulator